MAKIVGRFILARELGSGGMSTVYLGTDEVLDRPVAVKVLKSEFMESDIGARFQREGRTAARLSHPNIVQVYDAGEDDLDGEKVFYIVMEHVSGGDLRDFIRDRGTLSGEEISNLSGVAAGLAHAHERGIVHRDIKPHNILLDENGQPKLADFGIARALDATRATRTGTYMGTARYSSPEQLQGKEITPKSDIYSLGATLYEAATGDPPFNGAPIEVASQHVSKPPTPPGEIALVDEELEALILACLSKDPEDRPTATQVRSRLAEAGFYAEAPQASTPTATKPTVVQNAAPSGTVPAGATTSGRQRISRRAPLLVALVAVLAILGGVGAFALFSDDQQAGTPAGPSTTTRAAAGEQAAEPTTAGRASQETAEEAAEAQQSTPPSDTPEQATSETSEQEPQNEAPELASSQNGSEEEAAAQTIRDIYEMAADGNYGQSYDLVSEGLKQSTWPTQEDWQGTYDTLESISFLEGPNAQVTGDTAQVTAVTRAIHTDDIERNTGSWTLIREDGRWKMDSINVREI